MDVKTNNRRYLIAYILVYESNFKFVEKYVFRRFRKRYLIFIITIIITSINVIKYGIYFKSVWISLTKAFWRLFWISSTQYLTIQNNQFLPGTHFRYIFIKEKAKHILEKWPTQLGQRYSSNTHQNNHGWIILYM